MKSKIQEIRHKRLQYLFHLYETAEGQQHVIVNMWDLGKELGFSKDETHRIVEYLSGEYLLKHVTIDGGISITHSGVVRVENSYAELEGLMMLVPKQEATVQRLDTEVRVPQHTSTVRILFLAANPRDTEPLRLDEEMRAIDQALRQSEFRDRFDIKQHWAVRVSDVQSYFLRHTPDIVHFSGHGSASEEIILEDNSGNSQPVSTRALSGLFSVLKDNIRCVVLNACYSEQQAGAIAEDIDCVIGMSKGIGDAAAISFAAAFYQALGYGRNVKTAFDLGCLQIDLESLDEQDIPKLITLRSDPERVIFVQGE